MRQVGEFQTPTLRCPSYNIRKESLSWGGDCLLSSARYVVVKAVGMQRRASRFEPGRTYDFGGALHARDRHVTNDIPTGRLALLVGLPTTC